MTVLEVSLKLAAYRLQHAMWEHERSGHIVPEMRKMLLLSYGVSEMLITETKDFFIGIHRVKNLLIEQGVIARTNSRRRHTPTKPGYAVYGHIARDTIEEAIAYEISQGHDDLFVVRRNVRKMYPHFTIEMVTEVWRDRAVRTDEGSDGK